MINTGTTIVTFLTVFLIQNSQNREGEALQAKLDELILALGNAEIGSSVWRGARRKKYRRCGRSRKECPQERRTRRLRSASAGTQP